MKNDEHVQINRRLSAEVAGEVYGDLFTRGRYATDASIYQMMPAGVVVPRTIEDVQATLQIAREFEMPVTPRGGGTSQCGQTVNRGLIIDNSRYLNKLLSLDVANRRCVVQPGIILDELNRLLKPHGLWFPVDVSTASRATIGGMTANNSCGQRSIYYGTMRHNVHSIKAILPSGASMHFGEVPCSLEGLAGEQRQLVKDLLALGVNEASNIKKRFPTVLRRVGGYNVDALIPTGPGNSSQHNIASLLVGSEGTLAYSTEIELQLWPLPGNRVLGVCHFPSFYQAMDAAQHLVELGPHAVELVDSTMISLARDIDLYKSSVAEFVRGAPAAILLVEFAFESDDENLSHLKKLHERMADLGFTWKGKGKQWGGVVEAIDPALQARIGEVRKAGLNIMMSMKSEGKPVSFVEDCAVELPDLAEFTAGLTEVFNSHGTPGTWYAHASVGCLHVRPVLNLKLEKDADTMRKIAEEAFDLVLKYKGSHSGEHGDGISRSEFHTKMFGAQMVKCFELVKQRFDPDNLFNPGKIVNAPRMNDRALFRYQPKYKMVEIKQELDWSEWTGASGGLQGAIEMCNNNGACRKMNGGAMCPSYRVTHNEKDVTRGRANTLRLAMSGQLGPDALTSDAMQDTLKLCVSCKACKTECPTGVDMAKMKLEVQAARARKYGYTFHDRLIAHLPRYAPLLAKFSGLVNLRNSQPWLARITERMTGFAAHRALPHWSNKPFKGNKQITGSGKDVVLLADTFNTWFEPEVLRDARTVLEAAGYRVNLAQLPGQRKLCCGRTYLASGMIEQARIEAQRMLDALHPWAEKGVPIVGLEPSCLLTLRDEYKVLIPGKVTDTVAAQAMLLEELIVNDHKAGMLDWTLSAPAPKALVHGHCHQKAMNVFSTVQKTLALIPGMEVNVIESSCCGMAGAFGYAKDTAEISVKMAELDLLPAVRGADADTLIVADGTSCRHQISSGSKRDPLHVAQVLALALSTDKSIPTHRTWEPSLDIT
ncbi:MAG: FAD/FMN-containing dehydrogenase/Fe-S oxidoreductase [Gammaproteobacteria bacterium]|jgi:FAD/FMN-containing dehydrogenase/Fe-S oxidoreductase